MRKGFTLVELSIVLVIIGLLIGGVLVAQSMIGTAKITTTSAQIGQFDAGVMNFKTKYNYLPGDAPAFGGNGNGVLEGDGSTFNDIFGCEVANFFANIDSQQFTGVTCNSPTSVKPIANGAGKNVPLSKLGSSGSFFVADSLSPSGVYNVPDTTTPKNYYVILSASQAQNVVCSGYNQFSATTSANSAVKPLDLLALDKKIDDGIANTGNVLSGRIMPYGCSGLSGGPYPSPLATCSSGATYATNDSYECTPLIRIGGQTGVLQ